MTTHPASMAPRARAGQRRFGLKEKFLIPLVCITCIILGATTFAMIKAERTLLDTAREKLLNAAGTVSHNVDVQLRRAQMDIAGASYLPDTRKVLSPSEMGTYSSREQFIAHTNRMLSAFSGASNVYETFYVTSGEGITLASSVPWDVGKRSIADQVWFHEAMQGNEAIISTPYPSETTGEMLVTVIRKISYSGFTGTIAGALRLSKLTASALAIGTDDGFQVALVTSCGLVLGSRNRAGDASHLADQPWFATAVKNDSGYTPITEEGEEKMLAYHRLQNAQLFALAVARKADLLAPAIFLHKLAVGIFLLTLTLACCNIYYTVVPMIRSIRDLAHTANKIGSGDLAQRIETTRNDEVGDLALSLGDMLDTLKTMIYRAEAATRAKSDFLARMSHEIRTPLNAVIGMAYLGIQDKKNGDQTEAFAKIHDAATSLLGIINDILDFSKIEADKIILQAEPFSVRGVITSTLFLVKGSAEEKGLILSLSIDENIPDILIGDALRLSQICTNLCTNAVKFTDHGAVTITVIIETKKEDVVTLRFSVADTGIGVTKEQQKDIFDAFSQADGSITRRFGGTGLGLAICKRLVVLMGGAIWVQSDPGRGSIFHFTVSLPVSPEQNMPITASNMPAFEAAPVKSARILIVEDNKLNREITVGMLKLMGITPTIACNGREAVDLCRQRTFDLILMDVQMPVMDGLEATRQIRNGTGTMRDVPIIAMTANALQTDRIKSLAAGMNAHLTKPISHAELAEAIRLWYAKTAVEA